jgi:hypothetical protein
MHGLLRLLCQAAQRIHSITAVSCLYNVRPTEPVTCVPVNAPAVLCLQVRAAELGMGSRQMVQTYAKEAATLLLAEVERYTMPLEVPANCSHSGNSVDMQQLSLNEFSGGLRSIQTAPSQQRRPHRPHDAAWGWLVPGAPRTRQNWVGCQSDHARAIWFVLKKQAVRVTLKQQQECCLRVCASALRQP